MKACKAIIFLFLSAISGVVPQNASANQGGSDFLVTTLPRPSRAEIRLISQEPKSFDFKSEDHKLWLTFKSNVQASRVLGIKKDLPRWIQDVRQTNPNQIYIEAKIGNSFLVERLDRSIILTILKERDPNSPTTPEIMIDKAPNRAELTFLCKKGALPKIEKDHDQFIFHFGEPINNPKLNELWKGLPQWITSSTSYYDSFVIRVALGIDVRIATKGAQIILTFAYSQKSERELQERELKASSPDVRLDRLTGQALLQADRDFPARTKFRDVINDVPDNLEAMRWLGDTEGKLKRWRRAVSVYDHMFSLDPQEYGVAFNKGFLYREYGSYVMFEPEWWKVEGQETQWIGRTSGRYLIGPSAEFLGVEEERYIVDGSALTKQGLSRTFEGSRRQGFGALAYNFDSMDRAQIGLYGANRTFGGGGYYQFGWKLANTKIGANYHATDWNYLQQIVYGGNVDSFNLAHDQQFGEKISLDAALSWNNFNLDYKKKVGNSVRANAALNYNAITGDPGLTIGYGYIAEYKGHRKKGYTPQNEPYFYLPISTYEIHSLVAKVGATLLDYLKMEASAGYALERFSTTGPLFGVAFYYEPISNFQFGLKANRQKIFSRDSGGASFGASGNSKKSNGTYLNTIGLSCTVRF